MRIILAVAATAMLSSAAFAADAIVYEEPAAVVVAEPTFSWSGLYVGAHAAYGWGDIHDVNNPNADKKKIDGGFGGIQAGYNWQFDNQVVLGLEGDISFGKSKRDWHDSNPNSSYYTKDEIGTHGTIRARLGYAADRLLPYITGGVAFADVKHTLGCTDMVKGPQYACSADHSQGKGGFNNSESKVRTGYVVGAGLEYAVTNNWSLKGEYLYSNFGKKSVYLSDPNYPNAAVNDRRFKTSLNEVRIGVNYKF